VKAREELQTTLTAGLNKLVGAVSQMHAEIQDLGAVARSGVEQQAQLVEQGSALVEQGSVLVEQGSEIRLHSTIPANSIDASAASFFAHLIQHASTMFENALAHPSPPPSSESEDQSGRHATAILYSVFSALKKVQLVSDATSHHPSLPNVFPSKRKLSAIQEEVLSVQNNTGKKRTRARSMEPSI